MTSVFLSLEELQALRRSASAERSRVLGGMAEAAMAWLKRRFTRPFTGGFHAAH
jgi:hypothetical protein